MFKPTATSHSTERASGHTRSRRCVPRIPTAVRSALAKQPAPGATAPTADRRSTASPRPDSDPLLLPNSIPPNVTAAPECRFNPSPPLPPATHPSDRASKPPNPQPMLRASPSHRRFPSAFPRAQWIPVPAHGSRARQRSTASAASASASSASSTCSPCRTCSVRPSFVSTPNTTEPSVMVDAICRTHSLPIRTPAGHRSDIWSSRRVEAAVRSRPGPHQLFIAHRFKRRLPSKDPYVINVASLSNKSRTSYTDLAMVRTALLYECRISSKSSCSSANVARRDSSRHRGVLSV